MSADGPYRDGKVHVQASMCFTCIYRPGNLMRLQPGRVKSMSDDALRDGSAITCHATLEHTNVPAAVCRGFFDANAERSVPLTMAARIGILEFDVNASH